MSHHLLTTRDVADPLGLSAAAVIVALDTETLEQLRAAARAERATLAAVIRQAIRGHLNAAVRKGS